MAIRRRRAPERERLAGLDRDAPEPQLAELGERLLDEVVRADRDAAAGDDDVGPRHALAQALTGCRRGRRARCRAG